MVSKYRPIFRSFVTFFENVFQFTVNFSKYKSLLYYDQVKLLFGTSILAYRSTLEHAARMLLAIREEAGASLHTQEKVMSAAYD